MPRKVKQYASDKATGDWSGFVRCEFDATSKERFVQWCETNPFDDTLTELMDWVTENALKLSISFDPEQQNYTASLSGGKLSVHPFKGWTLTARSNSWDRAVQALAFKHGEMLKGDWVTGIAMEGDKGKDFVS